MRRIIVVSAALISAVSCNMNEVVLQQGGVQEVVVAASLDSESQSRVALSDNESGGYTVTWREEDTVGAWGTGEGSLTEFEMASWGLKQSTFKGTMSSDAATLRLVHPYVDTAIENDELRIELSSQTAAKGLDHLSSTTYMISDEAEVSANAVAPMMRHVGATMDLVLDLEEIVGLLDSSISLTLWYVKLTGSEGSEIPTAATINLSESVDSEEFFVSKEGGSMIVMVDEAVEAVDNIYTIPFNIIPFDVASGGEIEVEATFSGSNDKTYRTTIVATNASEESVEFRRATRNRINATATSLKWVITIDVGLGN